MNEPLNQVSLILLSLILALLFEDLVENHLIFNNRDVTSLIFWYTLGFMPFLRLHQQKEIVMVK